MERISRLLYKHLRGTLSEAEEAELTAWAAADPANRALLERVGDGERFDADLRAWYALPRKSVADDPRLDAEITAHERGSKVRRLRPWLPYAAAAAILLAVGWLLLVDSRESSVDGLAATEILPGGNRATLTLADGRVINLDEAQTGIIVGAEDITYTDGSALAAVIPSAAEESLPNPGDAPVMLSLTTPKGGTYQITLPDGSKAWLNSASMLKYPSRFSGDSREVILEGEAYFDIQPQVGRVGANPEGLIGDTNHSPFSVQTANQVVNVLGTEFNISAYADDPETKTTLVTGKVRVDVEPVPTRREANKHSPHKGVTLTPGQQATTRGAATTINTVDIDQHTAWKSGKFSFEGKSFEQVMRELARWYDLEVVYEGDIPQETFFGDAYRNTNLSVVLGALQSAEIDYRIEQGRKLIIAGKRGGKP